MADYTLKGSAGLDARIDADMATIAQAVADLGTPVLRAVVLMGGYGRGEGTPCLQGDQQVPFNDYDLVVVSQPLSRSSARHLRGELKRLETELTATCGLPVDLCLYTTQRLRQAEFSLLNCEMRYGHRVIWGEPDILEEMPTYHWPDLPPAEGTRLLMNRGTLLLDIQRMLSGEDTLCEPPNHTSMVKFLFKAFLAFGDCALMAVEQYDIRYETKKSRLQSAIAATDVPDPDYLTTQYLRAVGFKEWGDPEILAGVDLAGEWPTVQDYFVRFWFWYEGLRLGVSALGDPDAYVRALQAHPRQTPLWRVCVLNALTFRQHAFSPTAGTLFRHPRQRLFAAMPQLLARKGAAAALSSLLAEPLRSWDQADRVFRRLQERFS